MGSEKFSNSAKAGYNKGTIRSDTWYLEVSKDVRRHRLISISYITTLPCHGRGREFESRRPRHSFQKSCSDSFFSALRTILCDSRHAVVCLRVKRHSTRRLTNAAACIFGRLIFGLNYLAGTASKGRTSRSTLSAISSSATSRS